MLHFTKRFYSRTVQFSVRAMDINTDIKLDGNWPNPWNTSDECSTDRVI